MIKVQVAAVSALPLKSQIECERACVLIIGLQGEEKAKEATKQTFMDSRVDPSARRRRRNRRLWTREWILQRERLREREHEDVCAAARDSDNKIYASFRRM